MRIALAFFFGRVAVPTPRNARFVEGRRSREQRLREQRAAASMDRAGAVNRITGKISRGTDLTVKKRIRAGAALAAYPSKR